MAHLFLKFDICVIIYGRVSRGTMRVFYAFIIIFASAILFMLPLTNIIYDFRTDSRTDIFSATTNATEDSANVTLLANLYDCDMGSIDIASDNATDAPLPNTYNCTSRVLNIAWLASNTTRILDVTYDVDALGGSDAINTLADRFPWIWLLTIIAFGPAALFAIFTGRA